MSLASVLMAQETEKALAENPMRAGCTYHSYEAPADDVTTPAPKGYKPVYISHYGRHGSRYHSELMINQNYPRELLYADSLGLLTDTGKIILNELMTVYKVHEGMLGELSQKGFKEHQGIAERMYASFPQIWKDRKTVNGISSNYSRCVLSMGAFTGQLQALVPGLSVSAVAGKRFFEIVANEVEYHKEAVEEVAEWEKAERVKRFDPTRMATLLFKEVPQGLDVQQAIKSIHIYGCITESLEYELGGYLNIFRWFTPEELHTQWSIYSDVWYGEQCDSDEYGKFVLASSDVLLAHIVENADKALAEDSDVAADLRFGHDNGLMPLVFALGFEGAARIPYAESYKVYPDYRYNCKASNIQMIFYRNAKNDVLVKVLYNEKETRLKDLSPVSGPYYKWTDVRSYLLSK